jgi:archaellum component FlaG (FlaF/FlaG flagellin family)
MKIKKLYILIALIISFNFVYGQDEIRTNLPIIEFKETIHNFGEIEYKGNGTYEFVFKNIGKGPLLITNVRTS